jgi:hypothetical protein
MADSGAEKGKQSLAQQICNELKITRRWKKRSSTRRAFGARREGQRPPRRGEGRARLCQDLIAQLKALPADDLFDAKVTVLGEYIKHHVKEEQEELFPSAARRGWISSRSALRWRRESRSSLDDRSLTSAARAPTARCRGGPPASPRAAPSCVCLRVVDHQQQDASPAPRDHGHRFRVVVLRPVAKLQQRRSFASSIICFGTVRSAFFQPYSPSPCHASAAREDQQIAPRDAQIAYPGPERSRKCFRYFARLPRDADLGNSRKTNSRIRFGCVAS